jgi:hydrogenase expression/formation protein HypC
MCLGIPGKVIELYNVDGMKMGKIDFGGVIKEACLEYLPEIQVGGYAIVHVGFGISQIDEEQARQTLQMLREMDVMVISPDGFWQKSPVPLPGPGS